MLGDGDLPLHQMFDALLGIGYEGYVSLEWVKRWSEELSDAGVVFPRFAEHARLRDERLQRTPLQKNNAGTGEYIWPKETLIDLTFPDVLDKMVEKFESAVLPLHGARLHPHLQGVPRRRGHLRPRADRDGRQEETMSRSGPTNVPQWYITFWATTKIGAVLVTVNTAYKIHEAEYLLRQSDTHTPS